MIEHNVPGGNLIQLDHLVSDVNGTIALDGRLLEGVGKALIGLKDRLHLHLLTADTHRRQDAIDLQLGMKAVRIAPDDESEAKAAFVDDLEADRVVAIGQGANDAEMLRRAKIGICTLSPEGLAVATMMAADLIVPDVMTALGLLENPLRLVASLRK